MGENYSSSLDRLVSEIIDSIINAEQEPAEYTENPEKSVYRVQLPNYGIAIEATFEALQSEQYAWWNKSNATERGELVYARVGGHTKVLKWGAWMVYAQERAISLDAESARNELKEAIVTAQNRYDGLGPI